MARKTSNRSTGKIALVIAIPCAVVGLVAGLLAGLAVVANMADSAGSNAADAQQRGMIAVVTLSVVTGALGGVVGWFVGSKVGSRLTDLGLALSKLGRGGTEIRVRFSGNDEIAQLGRSLQYLANDLADFFKSQEESGGALATMDPLVRQLRDKTLPKSFPQVEDYELEAALSPGSRGGLDYFDIVESDGGAVLYLVSGEGAGAMSVLACRMARDELHRALAQKATPRKALSHSNRVMQQSLPAGACAKATLVQLLGDTAKLYQAGARAPLWIAQRGEVLELAAEGLALGLDDGAVFDKALRPQEIEMSPGTRLLVFNEGMLRMDGILERIEQHSSRHTAMFMNMVLGGIEQDAGDGGLREDAVLLTAKLAGSR